MERSIITRDSVTHLSPAEYGAVVVAASHGGLIAAQIAAAMGVAALVLNDAGVGLDQAGISGLSHLNELGVPGAVVDHRSARIGDGADNLARGIISHANGMALALGVRPGMAARTAARLLLDAAPTGRMPPPPPPETVILLERRPGHPEIWGVDSISEVSPRLDGAVVVSGSHGGLPGGHSENALRCAARAALFNDAGIGIDEAGIGRLPPLDRRGIAAATVDAMTARIGDARSAWHTGVVSRVNDTARTVGARPGMTVQAFARLFTA